MAQLIARKVGRMQGDSQATDTTGLPWEALLWTSLLQARSLHIATGDHVAQVEQTNGVRQGSPDSSVVFAALTAEALQAAVSKTAHMLGDARGPPPPEQGGAYMDDTYLWSHDRQHLQTTLTELEAQVARHGLVINPKKTAIIYRRGEIHHWRRWGGLPSLWQHNHGVRFTPDLRGSHPQPGSRNATTRPSSIPPKQRHSMCPYRH